MANLEGFNRKMASLAELAKAIKLLPKDAAGFAKRKLVNEILNLPETAMHPQAAAQGSGVIRRISGMLVRSVTLTNTYGDNTVRLFMNEVIAPYAQKVDDWSRNRYGRGYIELFLAFYKSDVEKAMEGEIKKAIAMTNKGLDYKYFNPFGA